jgi:dipeptidyl aminopeptidase/acylaminoacyl peptidase
MFCPTCGAANADGVRFCASCGRPLTAAGPASAAPPPAAPPPAAPPPAAPPPSSAGGWRLPVFIGLGALAVVAVVVLVYVFAIRDGDADEGEAAVSPSPSAAATVASPSASASDVSPSPTAGTGDSSLAVATGSRGSELSAISADGVTTRLDSGTGRPLTEISWSPDGARIAFVRSKSLYSIASSLWVYDVAAGTSTQVLIDGAPPATVFGYAWISPTELIASTTPTVPRKYRVNGALSRCDVAAGTSEPVLAGGTALQGFDPSASADGALVAFAQFGGKKGQYSIAETLKVYDTTTGEVDTVAKGTVDVMVESDEYNRPRISPDGDEIFTEQTGSDVGFQVTIYGVDGSIRWKSGYLLFPSGGAWDASGSGKLVFGGRKTEPGAAILFVYDPLTAGVTQLARVGKGYLRDFAWSPDGTQIAYTVMSPRNDYTTDDLWTIGADGAGPRRIARDAGAPAWASVTSPD